MGVYSFGPGRLVWAFLPVHSISDVQFSPNPTNPPVASAVDRIAPAGRRRHTAIEIQAVSPLADELQARMSAAWAFAPHDIRGGRKVHEQIDEAIRIHDKLLLIHAMGRPHA